MSHALDDADPLAPLRDRFVGTDSPAGLPRRQLPRPAAGGHRRPAARPSSSDEWGGRLIRGWDEGWFDLPLSLGDELGRVCLGAAPGQVAIGDSTTVLLYKLMRTAVAARPGRTEIVHRPRQLPDRPLPRDGRRGRVRADDALARRRHRGRRDRRPGRRGGGGADRAGRAQPRLLPLGVDRRRRRDHPGRPRRRRAGALGPVPLGRRRCPPSSTPGRSTWRPAAPTSTSTAGPARRRSATSRERHLETFTQPIQGWMGNTDPFLMGPDYVPGRRASDASCPAPRRWSGCWPIQDMVALIDEAGIDAVRKKSEQLTSYAVELADERLAPYGVTVASPRDPARRGGHVTLRHPRMQEVVTDAVDARRDPRLPRPRRPADRALAAVARRTTSSSAGSTRSPGLARRARRPDARRAPAGCRGPSCRSGSWCGLRRRRDRHDLVTLAVPCAVQVEHQRLDRLPCDRGSTRRPGRPTAGPAAGHRRGGSRCCSRSPSVRSWSGPV